MAGYPLQRFMVGSGIVPGPLVDEAERVYVACVDGMVACFDPASGTRVWDAVPAGPVQGGVALDGDRLYVADVAGQVLCLDTADGAVRWRETTARGVRGGIAVDPEGLLVTGHDDGHLIGFEPNGRIRWRTPLGMPVRATPSFDGDGNVVLPGLDLHLTSVHPSDGAVRWRHPLGNVAVGRAAVSPDGTVAVATLGGDLLGISAREGALRWTCSLEAPVVGGVVRLGEGWAVVTATGRVLGLDEGGQIRWEHAIAGPVGALPAVGPAPTEGAPDWMFVVSRAGRFTVFDADGACQARWEPWAGQPTPPVRALSGVARGRHGVVLTAEVGEVLYAPWNAPDLASEGWVVRPREVPMPPVPPAAEGDPPWPFRVTHWSMSSPPVASALDGLAGVELQIVMLAEHEDTGIAWGTVTHPGGVERMAWNARRSSAGWVLEATHAGLPWMGLRVPLQRLELTAGAQWGKVHMVAQVAPRFTSWMAVRDHPSAALERSGKPFLAARKLWERLTTEPPRLRELIDFGQGAVRTLAAVSRLTDAHVWGAWGLLDETRRFEGRGHVAIAPAELLHPEGVDVDHVHADASRRLVRAVLRGNAEGLPPSLFSIVLVDTRSTPVVVPLDYTRRTTVTAGDAGVEVVLEIPLDTNLARPVDAWVVLGSRIAWRGPLTSPVG